VIAAADEHSSAVAARRADLVIVHAPDSASARIAREQIRRAAEVAGRNPDDISVLVAARVGEPERRASLERIEASAGRAGLDLVGDAANVASTLVDWHASGAADGFLLQPDTLSDTLAWLAGEVLPELALAGHASGAPAGATLRDRSGLPRPTNRYALPEVAR
jgi:alkanesulfonate monooxygenase SsuD/methylene tetrahydromethanopterin reductase-like flavin-dependent oxidoreductase (luciferase family)